MLPLKATRIKENGNFVIKKLSTTLSNINIFELQTIRHAVIDWKEILSMIDRKLSDYAISGVKFHDQNQPAINKKGKIKFNI